MKPINIGIIGCGVICRTHAAALAKIDNGRLLAVADVRLEAAQKVAAEFDVPRVFDDPQHLLDDPEVDGVILALPTAMRTELALRAFAAGKHVLTEKPVAMNVAEVERLIAARGRLVAACCSSRYRFTPTADCATAFLAAGGLGRLRSLHCRFVSPAGPTPDTLPPSWRLSRAQNGGGILMNWGCYDLDFLLGITNWSLSPCSVSGATYGFPPQYRERLPEGQDAETHAIGHVAFQDGITLSYERAEMYPGRADANWEVSGDAGSLRLSMVPSATLAVELLMAPAEGGLQEQVLSEPGASWDGLNHGPTADFVNAIAQGVPPRTTLEQALVVAKITEGIYTSAAQGGRSVDIA